MDTKQENNDDPVDPNEYINQLTLNFLISKTQLHKLNKLKEKENDPKLTYDKGRITDLFNKLLNNNNPDDLLEDVKTCFDAFIEKSIYYLEIHDKNINIQNERNNLKKEEEEEDEEEEDEDFEDFEEEEEEEEEEDMPSTKVFTKYSNYNISHGVDDIQKLPLDWFNTTRQNYKINQIIPRKKEIIFDNAPFKK